MASSSKWSDPEFRRVYKRELTRKNHGKRHPNILEDGRRWTEVHPYGKYETAEEKRKAHREKYYTPAEKVKCVLCDLVLYKARAEKHLASQKHLSREALIQHFGLTNTSPFQDLGIVQSS